LEQTGCQRGVAPCHTHRKKEADTFKPGKERKVSAKSHWVVSRGVRAVFELDLITSRVLFRRRRGQLFVTGRKHPNGLDNNEKKSTGHKKTAGFGGHVWIRSHPGFGRVWKREHANRRRLNMGCGLHKTRASLQAQPRPRCSIIRLRTPRTCPAADRTSASFHKGICETGPTFHMWV